MREIVKFDPTKFEHLEQLVDDLDIGDLIQVYFDRGSSRVFEYKIPIGIGSLYKTSHLIVAAEHLPDDYLNPSDPSADMTNRSCRGFCRPGSHLAGVLYSYYVGSSCGGWMSFVDNKDGRTYRTKPSLWLVLGMNVPFTHTEACIAVRENMVWIPAVSIDVHCLGGYEKIRPKAACKMSREVTKEIQKHQTGDMKRYEEQTTEQQQLKMFNRAEKKKEIFLKQF